MSSNPKEPKIIYGGIKEAGILIEAVSGDEAPPLDLVLTNSGDRTALTFLIRYECLVKEDKRSLYTKPLREGKFFDRQITVGSTRPLYQNDPLKRDRLIREVKESLFAPSTAWLVLARGGATQIEGERNEYLSKSNFTPSKFYDMESYEQITIKLTAALIDGEFSGPLSEEFRQQISQEAERSLESFSFLTKPQEEKLSGRWMIYMKAS